MRNKNKVISILMFLSVFIMFVSCEKQKAGWKGTIEEKDGVIVVKNPNEPIYDEDVFDLEEELCIGEAEGREEYMFSRVGFTVDEDENIYVLDRRAANIRIFDKNGEYLKTIGKKGQGPGEFQRPRFMQITPQKEIMVTDVRSRRISFFSLDGEYLTQMSTAKMFIIFSPNKDSRGNFIGYVYDSAGTEIKKMDANLDSQMTIARIEYEPRTLDRIEQRIMNPGLNFILTQDGNIVWGYSDKYEINVVNSDGKVQRKILKDYEPIKLTDKAKEKYINLITSGKGFPPDWKISAPKYCPAFKNLSGDEEGRMFVGTYEEHEDKPHHCYFDVFDIEGRYIAKISIRVRDSRYIPSWKKKKLYIIDETDEGYQVIKRYKVSWSY